MPRAAKKPRHAAAAKKPRRAGAATTCVTAIDAVEDQGEEYRDWAQLLPDLVSKIADDLLSDDVTEYIRLRAVCKPWRSSTADPSLLDPRFFPRKWLLLAQEKLRRDGKPERLVNVSTGAELRILLPEPEEYTHHGNAEGLLVLYHADSDTVCLLNPLTMAFTDLPSMAAMHELDVADNAALNAYNIKATGVVVGDEAPANPTVVLSLNSGAHTAIVCAKPGDNVWRAVDTSWTDDIECELPAIDGGLSVHGRFFVPTRPGDVLEVELRPQPRLTFVARQAGENAESGLNGKSYLLPSGTDGGSGMLLLRTSRRPRNAFFQAFTVDLGNGRLTLCRTRNVADTTMFLPSITVRASVFPGLVPNMAYPKHKMMMLL